MKPINFGSHKAERNETNIVWVLGGGPEGNKMHKYLGLLNEFIVNIVTRTLLNSGVLDILVINLATTSSCARKRNTFVKLHHEQMRRTSWMEASISGWKVESNTDNL